MNQNPNESTVPFAEAAQLPDEFELLERLGEGGHGTVYKARFKLLDRIVAVKIIKSDASDDMRKQIERMQHEAKALAKLSHQNIVKVFQVGTCTDGRPFLVCEYLEGKTLEKFLLESKVLNKDQIKQIFPQILSALHYAHENNLVHRDIKPGNILLLEDAETKTLTVKLLDFGIAREIELPSESTPGLTRTSLLSGSPAYMSPEQCQGQKLDRRSDLYSTACIMYECLYGSAPFSGESELAIQYKHIHDPADSLEHIARESDLKLRQILIKSLAKDPGKRQQSAEQFKDELLKWLGDVKVTDPLINPHSLALAAFVILLVFAGTFVFNLMQSARKKQASSEIAILTEPVKKRRPRVARQSDISTLHSIVAEYYDQTSDEQYYDIKPDFRELIPELDKVIEHQLKKPSKTSQALIYFAYFWKARLQFTQRGFSIAEHSHPLSQL
ncbi:MAG: serine/threonine protein kinase [Candidatus Obscuribacterales bacterium]|nr:serine/threonine protein kinase [Candidatus Obscuribacterales bacterium]